MAAGVPVQSLSSATSASHTSTLADNATIASRVSAVVAISSWATGDAPTLLKVQGSLDSGTPGASDWVDLHTFGASNLTPGPGISANGTYQYQGPSGFRQHRVLFVSAGANASVNAWVGGSLT